MNFKQLLSGFFMVTSVALVLTSASCHSNDYDTSDTEQTTVSPSPDMHMTPGADHAIVDTMHMMKDSAGMHDTLMHDQHP